MSKLISTFVLAAAAALSGQAAFAQVNKVPVRIATASIDGAGLGAGKSVANRWVCAASGDIEIAQVSGDVMTDKSSYVRIHRQAGEVVASERLSDAEVAAFRRMGCSSGTGAQAGDQAVG